MIHLLLILLPLLGCTGTSNTDDDDDDSDADADADADTDADSDADTDADTDTDVPDLTTYEGFVEQHARAYCASLETCGYLDDRSYDSRGACATAITNQYTTAGCASYQQPAAEQCVRGDLQIATACEESRDGMEPLPCQDVCTAPPA
jgi:hypothetical protein